MSDKLKPVPDEASLHEAALAHLARYATTRTGMRRVLERRVYRWVRSGGDEAAVPGCMAAVGRVVERLVAAGLVDDAAFAGMRARSLTRAGRSRMAVVAHLRGKGVEAEIADAALPEDGEAEFAAALMQTRRRRIGAFRTGEADPKRELAALARAGFSQEIARRALATDRAEAEAVIHRVKQA